MLQIKPVKYCVGQNYGTGDKPVSVSTVLLSFHKCFYDSVMRKTTEKMSFVPFRQTEKQKKGNEKLLVYFEYQNVNSIYSHDHHHVMSRVRENTLAFRMLFLMGCVLI